MLGKVDKIICNRSGLSLVELLVAILLLNVVLAVAFGFYFFGAKTFATGEKQSDIQQNARMTADFITRELRYASEIAIVEDAGSIPGPDAIGDEYSNYIFFNNTDKTIELRRQNVSRILFDSFQIQVDELAFNKIDDLTLEFVIRARRSTEENPYEIKSTILAENLGLLNTPIVGTGGIGVYYSTKRPLFPVSILAYPHAVTAKDNFDETFTLTVTTDSFVYGISPAHFILGGDFAASGSSVSIIDASWLEDYRATVRVSGVLDYSIGLASITVRPEGLVNGENPLTARIIVYPKTRKLTVARVGNGTVTPAPGTYEYNFEEVATVSAMDAGGWEFVRWVINGVAFAGEEHRVKSVVMDANKSAVAYFRTPLESLPGGSYVLYEGVKYLKLSGNNRRVLQLATSGKKKWDTATAAEKALWPSKAELEGELWNNSLRGGVGEYWTQTPSGSNKAFYVKTDGSITDTPTQQEKNQRLVVELSSGLYAYDGDGTSSKPYKLMFPE